MRPNREMVPATSCSGSTWPEEVSTYMAKTKTKDLKVRLEAATAALVLLTVLTKLMEMVVQLFHH